MEHLLKIVVVCMGAFLLYAWFGGGSKTSSESNDPCDQYFGGNYPASVYEFKELVKKKLNDPKSFEHINTTYNRISPDIIDMTMVFTAKNGFGGTIKNIATGKIKRNPCSVIDVKILKQ